MLGMLHHMKRPSFNDMVVHSYHHSIDTGTFFWAISVVFSAIEELVLRYFLIH